MARRRGSIQETSGGQWRVRWWTSDGRHPSRTFERKAEAEGFLRNALKDAGRPEAPAHRLTVKDAVDDWWRAKTKSVKPRTVDRYLLHARVIEQRLGRTPLLGVTFDVVQEFILDLQADYAPKTVRGTYGVLRLVLQHAHRRGKISGLPAKPELPKIAKPKLTIPTLEQVELLAAESQAWLYAAVILAGYCGLRQGEVLGVERGDVNLTEGWVFVHQSRNKSSGEMESTKTEAVRRVYLPSRVRTVMREHLDEERGPRVFPVTASVFDKSWRGARARCDLGSVRFHDLRHCAASMMIAAGGTVLQVSQQLGHSNPTQTLDTYGHLWPGSLADLMTRVDEHLSHAPAPASTAPPRPGRT